MRISVWLSIAANCNLTGSTKGSLWEGAVSRRLTEGESPGFFDAVSYEALVVDLRSLLQSASRPAPSQREPLVLPAKLQLLRVTLCRRELEYCTNGAQQIYATLQKDWKSKFV